jgi:GNAT superfamily N-acetyltransferase
VAEYIIRPYQPDDKEEFLSLFETVMGKKRTTDWFDWKYEKNPYVDHVPMIVALNEGTVIGARPLFALPLVINGEQDIALQPGDAMVHPEYRRQGLFSRMMEQMVEKYSESCPFYFSFPNSLSEPAHIKHGSQIVSKRSSYYRIENPSSIAETRTDRDMIQLISRIGTPIAKKYYRFRDAITGEGELSTIRTESDPPVADLAALYRTSVPDKIHAFRDEQFYQWRLKNPDWKYTTYIAGGDAGLEAAIITGTSVDSDSIITKLTDVVPVETAPDSVLVGLISQILADHSETDLFVAPSQGIPDSVLKKFGFHPDTTPPLSFLASQTTHVVRTLTTSWTHNGMNITNPDNWLLTFIEEDTS